MVKLKSEQEMNRMAEGGEKLQKAVRKVLEIIKPGVTTDEIDCEAEKQIKEHGAEPSFKKVKGFYWSTCLPVNDQVVHTPPSDRQLKEGDILTVDIGVYYKSFHTDFATTFVVGKSSDPKIDKFLKVGKETLKKSLKKAEECEYLGEISGLIEKEIYGSGYFILKALTGHGIGSDLHEDPFIPGFLDRPVEKTYKVRPGLVVAIEVIYSAGTEKIKNEHGSDWSVVTEDRSVSACFEHTIAFTNKGVIRLT